MRHVPMLVSVLFLGCVLSVAPVGLAQSLTFTFSPVDPPGAVSFIGASPMANGIGIASSTGGTGGQKCHTEDQDENQTETENGQSQMHHESQTEPECDEETEADESHHGGGGLPPAPGSVSSSVVGTYYTFSNNAYHLNSYLLTGTTFSPVSVVGSANVFATGVNGSGVIVGYYVDSATFTVHGFIQPSGGTASRVDVPVSGASLTTIFGISAGGKIAGEYLDAKGLHGYVCAGTCTATTFSAIDVQGAMGTTATGVNDVGQTVGTYADFSGAIHSYLHTGSTFTNIDVTDTQGALTTLANGINGSGQIVGYFIDRSNTVRGFLRSATNTVTTVWPSNLTGVRSTTVNGISDSGELVGEFVDSLNQQHGYKTGP